jgi:putative DNA primase/helicase
MNDALAPTPIAPVVTAAAPAEKQVVPFDAAVAHRPPAHTVQKYVYLYADGGGAFVVYRVEKPDAKKSFLQYVSRDGKTLTGGGHPAPRPLFELPSIVSKPAVPVLVVEGEKAVYGAQQYLPANWLVTTWAGGASAWKMSDWAALAGRRVVIWPDNDTPGHAAADGIAAILNELKVPNVVVTVPASWGEGWDLADPLPDGVTAERITKSLHNRLAECTLPDDGIEEILPEVVIPGGEPVSDKQLGIDVNKPGFVALGHESMERYVFFSSVSNTLVRLSTDRVFMKKGLLTLLPGVEDWNHTLRTSEYNSIGIYEPRLSSDWETIGVRLARECQEKGEWADTGRAREAGVWLDRGRIITNTGKAVYVNGEATLPYRIESKHIYPFCKSTENVEKAAELTDAEGQKIVDICDAFRWQKQISGTMLSGLIACAIVGGALKWRPHGAINGPRGSGKSWVVNTFVKKCLGDFCIQVEGSTSEAGIRSLLGASALPVTFDEAEKGEKGNLRMDKVIELMRISSTSTGGGVAKGSADHKGHMWKINSVFIIAAIGIGNLRPADLSRICILTLRGADETRTETRNDIRAHFDKLQRMVDNLPMDMAPRLIRRMMSVAPIMIRNAEVLARVIASQFSDARTGDQIGMLIAGSLALTSRELLTEKRAKEKLVGIDWSEYNEKDESREDSTMINWLLSQHCDVETNQGYKSMRTLGQLIAAALEIPVAGETLDKDRARRVLEVFGLKFRAYAFDEVGFCVAKNFKWLNDRFADSPYPGSYFEILARHPDVKPRPANERGMRFAGPRCDWLWLPATAFVGDDQGVD